MKTSAGKGMKPIIGYNPKNWNTNYSDINWHNKWCAMCEHWTNHKSNSCPKLIEPKKYERK